jgi:hypothetical protein
MSVKDYATLEVLLDVTVNTLAPGAGIEAPTSSSITSGATTITVTPNTIPSSALSGTDRVAEALYVGVIPPVAADGSSPDFEFYFKADDTSLEQYMVFDGSLDANVAPMPYSVVGGPVDREGRFVGWFTLGKSTRSLLRNVTQGERAKDIPLQITGIKYTDKLTVFVRSNTGWDSTRLVPARIIVMGEKLTRSVISQIARGFNGMVNKQLMQREINGKPPISFVHSGIVSFETWNTLPGGTKQSGMRVYRFLRWSSNNTSTGAQAPFTLTKRPGLQGADANVVDSAHDLGFETSRTNQMLVVRGFGCRPHNNQAYFGWLIDNEYLPTPSGWEINPRVNIFNYGSVQPLRPEAGLYQPIPRYQGELLLNGENAVPFITANGTAIPQGGSKVVVDGVIIEKV